MKQYIRVLRTVAMFSQLGFTLITPPVVMALLGWWLHTRFGLGVWIVAAALVIGLVTAGASAWQFYLRVIGSGKKKRKSGEQDHPVVFYTHE